MSINLDAIQARADAASPGPWTADSGVRGDCVVWGPNGKFLMNQQAAPHWVDAPGDQKRAVSFDVDKRDGEFIAAARTDVPALLAYARDLEARRDMLTMACEEAEECGRDSISVAGIRAALTATEGQS